MTYLLRLIEERDYIQFFELIDHNRDRLKRYFPNTVKAVSTIDDAKKHLKDSIAKRLRRENYLFGLYNSEKLIGYINVKNIVWTIPKCELGYFIDEASQGKGLMTKYIGEVLRFCFDDLKIVKVYLRIAKENIGSIRIAEKNGFKKEGILRKEFRIETGELIDVEYYGKVNL